MIFDVIGRLATHQFLWTLNFERFGDNQRTVDFQLTVFWFGEIKSDVIYHDIWPNFRENVNRVSSSCQLLRLTLLQLSWLHNTG